MSRLGEERSLPTRTENVKPSGTPPKVHYLKIAAQWRVPGSILNFYAGMSKPHPVFCRQA